MKKTIRLTESELRGLIVKIIKESRGNGYGLSKSQKEDVRDEHNPVRHYTHKVNRGKKKIKGDMSGYNEYVKKEGENGNPYSKRLKKGGDKEWTDTMLKHKGIDEAVSRAIRKVLKENIGTDKQMVENFLRERFNINGQIEWLNDNYFMTEDGCNGSIFNNVNEAYESVLSGENHQNAIDYVDGAQSDDDWIDYLINGGVNPEKAKQIIMNGDWNQVVQIILDADGPEWFLSTYSGEVYDLPNGQLLYY